MDLALVVPSSDDGFSNNNNTYCIPYRTITSNYFTNHNNNSYVKV
jgi:hypothetical protein